jgi:cupin fold WbuC family metalloprotein
LAEEKGLIMKGSQIPQLSDQEINDGLLSARSSARHRHPKLLHNPGDEFNRVFNFIMQDSYMQPHLHPGDEKIEEINLVQGKIAVLFFGDQGAVTELVLLQKGGIECVKIPAFSWHTYVMLSENAISYETMMGRYEPKTWKVFAEWAPPEKSPESLTYLNFLKEEAAKRMGGRQS